MKWNSDLYNDSHSFIYKFGSSLIELLKPSAGEHILDVGCGSGQLTQEIADFGCQVIGIDASESMIADAKARFPKLDFGVMDGQNIQLDTEFDAIFSNAAFHWMPNAEQVVKGLAQHLKTGGRLVIEFGGKNNVESIQRALERSFEKRNLHFQRFWYFPSIGEYASLLEKYDFRVTHAQHYDRDTPLEGEDGMKNWIKMFGDRFFEGVASDEVEKIIDEAVESLRANFYTPVEGWWADYKRIRIVAIKE